MVNTLSHLGVGLLLSYALGLKGRKRLVLLFLSLLPDLDYFTYSIFTLISGSVSHEARNQLFYLLTTGVYTLDFFAFLVALLIWFSTKDRRYTFGGLQAVFLHILLDYTTSAKMRPFYPFSAEESALRAIYPFDPILNLLPLLPLFIVASEFVKNRNRQGIRNWGGLNIISSNNWIIKNGDRLSTKNRNIWSTKDRDTWSRKLNGLNRFHGLVNRNERKFYASVILVLLLWTAVSGCKNLPDQACFRY